MSPANFLRAYPSYDGSLDTLVLILRRALDADERPDFLPCGEDAQPSLFDEPVARQASTGEEMSEAARYLRAFSGLLFDLAIRAWMSSEGVEDLLIDLAFQAGREGPELLEDYSIPQVRALRAACQRVEREIHRLEGLARFSLRRDGLYSAPLEPDHNILAALLPHFRRRFGAQPFAIVDLRRCLALESRGDQVRAHSGAEARSLLPDDADDGALLLWRRYFDATENPARRNPALQRRLMPARYWKYLPELARSTSGREPPSADYPKLCGETRL